MQHKIERKSHKIDAAGKIAGRLATGVAVILMGKNKPTYFPNVDAGDFVVIANVAKLRFSGKKLAQTFYFSNSGYPGGLKKVLLGKMFAEKPDQVFRKMVYNMLPKNTLRKAMIKRLTFSTKRAKPDGSELTSNSK